MPRLGLAWDLTGKATTVLRAGGGVAFTSSKDKDLPPAVARLADMISSQSVLHFTAADPERNGVARKLEVRLPIKEVEIHALPAYFAPAK